MDKNLTWNEFIGLAKKNYTKGGMDYVECWDEAMFNEYCKEFGPITLKKAYEMLSLYYEWDLEHANMATWK